MKTSIEYAYLFLDDGYTTVTRKADGHTHAYFETREPGLEYAGDTYLILRDNGDYLCESTQLEYAEFLVKALETVDEQKILEEIDDERRR